MPVYPSWMQPHFMDEQGNLTMSVHALVVDTGERRILVDTCIGNDKERNVPNWSHLQTHFLHDLEDAGYAPDTIALVLCIACESMLVLEHYVGGWSAVLTTLTARPLLLNERGGGRWKMRTLVEQSGTGAGGDSVRQWPGGRAEPICGHAAPLNLSKFDQQAIHPGMSAYTFDQAAPRR